MPGPFKRWAVITFADQLASRLAPSKDAGCEQSVAALLVAPSHPSSSNCPPPFTASVPRRAKCAREVRISPPWSSRRRT